MNSSNGRPIVCPIPNSDMYEVATPYEILGKRIPAGYRFDGASVPRLCWTALGLPPHHPRVMRAALYHDHDYSRSANDGAAQDEQFRRLLVADGVKPHRARLMYWAVRAWRR